MNNQNIKIFIFFALALLVLVGGAFFVFRNDHIQKDEKPNRGSVLLEKEARAIAEKSCIKGGGVLAEGMYNEITKTWWFDANLNAMREGCNPACVVSEETKTAEINWRCTGLITPDIPPSNDECTCPDGYRKDGEICNPECSYSSPPCLAPSFQCQEKTSPTAPPTSDECGIANCHGLDIECGQPVEMCTEMYQLGDRCRQYAVCSNVNGACRHIENQKFTACKSCVQQCEKDSSQDSDKTFLCESACGE